MARIGLVERQHPLPVVANFLHGVTHHGVGYAVRLAIAALLLSAPLRCAADPGGGFLIYRTIAGDTLIGIGRELLQRPRNWVTLQRLNAVSDPYRMPTGAALKIPFALLRREPASARVSMVSGSARSGDSELAAGSSIDSGEEVTTGDEGYATLILADGSTLTLQPHTRLRLDSLQHLRGTNASINRISLDQGRVEAETVPQQSPAAQHHLRMPAVVLSVRSTHYRAAVKGADGRSLAEVTQGKVAIGKSEARGRPLRQGFGVAAAPGKPLPAPTALLPAPDLADTAELQQRLTLHFRFTPLTAATAYRVQIAADQGFHEVLGERVVAAPEAKLPAPADGDYWLRVRGIDRHGLEGLDGLKQFQIRARPEPPFPSQPRNGGKAGTDSLEFRWAAVSDATRFDFQIAHDKDFTSLLAASTQTADTSYSPSKPLPQGEYYWRVASVRADGKQGPYGDVQRFQLRAPPATPEPPTIDDQQVQFTWSGEAGQTFEFQLARDTQFISVIETRRLAEPEATLQRPEPGTYYMRVRATDSDGFVGPYTATQRFVIPRDKPWWWLLFLAVPFSL
jgi:hypothetical protein